MARPSKSRCICSLPEYCEFVPTSGGDNGTVNITLDEYEVFRLLGLEKKKQSECADKMNISRPSVSRIYDSVCEKLALALSQGKRITISGGDVNICLSPKPECINEEHCCHRKKGWNNFTYYIKKRMI